MRKLLLVALTTFSVLDVSGCDRVRDFEQSLDEDLLARDQAACRAYGFNSGTVEFATCMQRESLARRTTGDIYQPFRYSY